MSRIVLSSGRVIHLAMVCLEDVQPNEQGQSVVTLTFAALTTAAIPASSGVLSAHGNSQQIQIVPIPLQVTLTPSETTEYLELVEEIEDDTETVAPMARQDLRPNEN